MPPCQPVKLAAICRFMSWALRQERDKKVPLGFWSQLWKEAEKSTRHLPFVDLKIPRFVCVCVCFAGIMCMPGAHGG